MKVAVIGTGLIGGSMALDLKRRGFADEGVIGVESDPANAQAALRIGIADRLATFDEALAEADVSVLAVPADVAVRMLPRALDIVQGSSRVVLDVCSVKERLTSAVSSHPARGRYVATHPMAGTEYSGPWAAMSGMFDGRACIFADSGDSDADAVSTAAALYDTLNMRVLRMSARSHDVHTAYVSHISHVSSFALALTVLDKERDEKHIFDLASGGFSSTVRLAKSSADMWEPILLDNKDNVLQVMDTYISKMEEFRRAIAEGDGDKIRSLILQANRIKRIIR